MTLYLLGTDHFDPKGPERLEAFLEWVRPNKIVLETSPETHEFNTQDHADYLANKDEIISMLSESHSSEQIRTLKTILHIASYESWVVQNHIDKHREEYKDIIQLGFSEAIPYHHPEAQEFIDGKTHLESSYRNFLIDKTVEELQTLADKENPNPLAPDIASFLEKRIVQSEKDIREFYNNSDVMVVLRGEEHLKGPSGLASRLKDLYAHPIRLPEVDNFMKAY